jgi:Chitobiase/beta-hexosaminidase C-terminal domain
MKTLLSIALLLCCLPVNAQLAAPSFGLTSIGTVNPAYTVTFGAPLLGSLSGPTGATICVGINMTPTAGTAGVCDSTANEFTYSAPFTTSNGTLNAISTQSGQTNSAVTTQIFVVPTFGDYTSGSYSTTISVPIYADQLHLGGAICYTTDGSTPTESGNSCTHGTTYSAPVTVAASLTLKALFTKSGQSDTTASATYTIVAQQTWFIRTDGGTYYDSNVTAGQCNGKYDAAYPGSGTNQNCALNDVRYLWSDNSGAQNAWIISGGDTIVIRGCTALSAQLNPSNPNCRLGYDNATNGNPPNEWCG